MFKDIIFVGHKLFIQVTSLILKQRLHNLCYDLTLLLLSLCNVLGPCFHFKIVHCGSQGYLVRRVELNSQQFGAWMGAWMRSG